MASIPSSITVPVKAQVKPSVGLATILGAGTGVTGLTGAALAFALGDRTPETMAAIVGGVVTGVTSIVTVCAGRYLQAHAALRGKLGAEYVQPIASRLAAGDTVQLQGEFARLEESLIERLTDRLAHGETATDFDAVDDEAEPTPLDAIPEPDPVNVRPEPRDPEITASAATVDDGSRSGPQGA